MAGKTGRPSDYTQEMASLICQRIAEGESLRSICNTQDMPSQASVFRWLANQDNITFREQYARAREAQTEYWAQQIIDIADTPMEGVRTEEGTNAEGVPFSKTVHEDMLAHRRLQIDSRKWLMSKLAPKKYGDRVAIGGDAALGPVEVIHKVERVIVRPETTDSSGIRAATRTEPV